MDHFLRPPIAFAQVARRFQRTVSVVRDGHRVDGKDPLELVLLGAPRGATLMVEVSGPDAARALQSLLAVPFVSDVCTEDSDGSASR
jgi:phosphotransferase system HPr (HPr) family protein